MKIKINKIYKVYFLYKILVYIKIKGMTLKHKKLFLCNVKHV